MGYKCFRRLKVVLRYFSQVKQSVSLKEKQGVSLKLKKKINNEKEEKKSQKIKKSHEN